MEVHSYVLFVAHAFTSLLLLFFFLFSFVSLIQTFGFPFLETLDSIWDVQNKKTKVISQS